MAVIQYFQNTGISASAERSLDFQFEEEWTAICSWGTTAADVLASPMTHNFGQAHPDFPIAYLKSMEPTEEEDAPFLFRVRLIWTTLEPDERPDQSTNQNESPLNERAVRSVKSTTVREAIQTDIEGDGLVNTAGDLLVGVEEDEVLWEVNIRKNIPPNFPDWLLKYANAVNKDTVKLRGLRVKKHKLKISGIDIPDSEWKNGVEFIPLTLKALYREKGWERKFLNLGLREKKKIFKQPTGDQFFGPPVAVYEGIQPIVIDGEPISDPIPLDENGRAFRKTVVQGGGQPDIEVIQTQVTTAQLKKNERVYRTRPFLPFKRLRLFS